MESLIVTSLITGTIFLLIIPDILKRYKRHKIRKTKFPDIWETYLKDDLKIYNMIPYELREKLKEDIMILIYEKRFEGCQGTVITGKKKVLIAAQACLLFINKKSRYYPKLDSILVYPDRYKVKQAREINGVPVKKGGIRLGESWQNGEVVLAWSNVMEGFNHTKHNVVIHEFAHQIDQETGYANGFPALTRDMDRKEWTKVLKKEYKKLVFKKEHNKISIINKYGATNPAEFFAVITELFFEDPLKLNEASIDLYLELKKYYKIDTKKWYLEDK
ncbi:MAG: M90 family metallopeptidase [Fusobacteriota bacterium]